MHLELWHILTAIIIAGASGVWALLTTSVKVTRAISESEMRLTDKISGVDVRVVRLETQVASHEARLNARSWERGREIHFKEQP
jgi:hypothetical protein